MKDNLKYIDEFYKSKLIAHNEATETVVWDRLKWTLFWMRHKWVISLSSIVILLGIGSVFSYSLLNKSPNTILTAKANPEIILAINESLYSEQIINNTYNNVENDALFIKVSSSNESPIQNTSSLENNESSTEDNGLFNDNELLNTNVLTTEKNHFGLSKLKSITFNYGSLSTDPDSTLLGFNMRHDIFPPGIKNQWFSFNVYAGPSYSESTITGYDPEYLALRNSKESNNPGWTIGTDFRFHIKNWIITTGLEYSVYNQRRSYVKNYQKYSPELSYFDYDTTWVWVFDPPDFGKPRVKSIDSSWIDVYEDITIDNSGLNQIKYFEIPLLIGYQYNTNLFALEVNSGVSFGFLSYSSLKVPDFTNNDEIVNANNINKSMLNFVANASLYYHLNRKTSLFVSPYFKQNLQSVFNNNNPVKQQFKTFGVNFGVNIRF